METLPPNLLEQLRSARENAYAPYSHYHVAALIECPDGSRFVGCNVETAHYKSICAEASAISAMVAAGRTRIRQVWVLGGGDEPCPPCGDCRQRLFEFSDEHTEVHLVDADGRIHRSEPIGHLLPGAFRLNPEASA
ncbi:MAG: cytidine deaminase [Wenzhouxiangellaceae bacterium]|nr:cytidine deaminase [Wenzhouxiangellaceae bacterium]